MVSRFCVLSALFFAGILPGFAEGDTPSSSQSATTNGFNNASVKADYMAWSDRQAKTTVEKAAEFGALLPKLDIFGNEVLALSWWISDDVPKNFLAGGLSFECAADPNESIYSSLLVKMDDMDERCDWAIWQVDFHPDEADAEAWENAPFDMEAATLWLQGRGITQSQLGKASYVDWSDFSDLDTEYRDKGVRYRSWPSKTCPAVLDVLAELEDMPPVSIDIRKFNDEGPAQFEPRTVETYRGITIYSGYGAELTFSGRAGPAADITESLRAVMQACEPAQKS